MSHNKGQAAMEFLMTYGWAILVVVAAIAALAYFGVLSPDRFLPEKCTLPSGLACLDSTVEGTGNASSVTISIQNSLGFDIVNIMVNLTSDTDLSCSQASDVNGLANGEKDVFTVTGCTLPSSGAKLKANLVFRYNNSQSLLGHTAQGELLKKMP
jgi:hypothetical protein